MGIRANLWAEVQSVVVEPVGFSYESRVDGRIMARALESVDGGSQHGCNWAAGFLPARSDIR